MKDWVEIVVPVPADGADDVAAFVADGVDEARAGIELRAGEIVFWVERAGVEAALGKTRAVAAELVGFGIDPAAVTTRDAAPEAEWRDAWKRHFRAARLSDRIAVVPSWDTFETRPGDVVISLDPGQAFGTGLHASTRLCLEELDRLQARGVAVERVLDFGCGSGILAIAAAKLWPGCRVDAVDNDPLAVEATEENAARNGVATQVAAALEDQSAPGSPVVVANIQRNVLLDFRDHLVGKLAPGGTLVLAGLLAHQAPEVAEAYAAAGLEVDEVRTSTTDAEWSAVRLRRPQS